LTFFGCGLAPDGKFRAQGGLFRTSLKGIEGVIPLWVSRLVSPGAVAALIVSTIFAWAHDDMAVPAFIFSLTLSWLALKHKFSLSQRAFLHGIYNGAVMSWFLTDGFGVYSG
jgi:hypothetical protein